MPLRHGQSVLDNKPFDVLPLKSNLRSDKHTSKESIQELTKIKKVIGVARMPFDRLKQYRTNQ